MRTLTLTGLILSLLSLASGARAQSGNYLLLDGSTGYMTVADAADLNIGTGQSFSLTMQVKTTTGSARMISKRNGTATTSAGYELFIGSNAFTANLRATNTTNAGPAAGIKAIRDGVWHHLALVVNATDHTCRTYIDGVQDQLSTNAVIGTGSFVNTAPLSIGAAIASSVASAFFKGQYDNIRVWSKALSAADLVTDMTSTVDGTTDGLVAAWDFENVSGTTVPDITGLGHPGTLVGGCTIVTPNTFTLTQTELPSGIGAADQRILSISVNVTSPVTVSAFNIGMDGTTAISDVSNVKLYYTAGSPSFSTGSLFGSAPPATGTISVTGSQALTAGTWYFWIAYDVSNAAAEGNLLDASCASVVLSGTTYPLSPSVVAGTRTILLSHTLVCSPGDFGSAYYRIPAIVTAADGSLVIAADARISSIADLPNNIHVVTRRSTDRGQTWSTYKYIANFGNSSTTGAGDASLVLDKNTGNIICLFQYGPGINASSAANPARIMLSKSSDNGINWTAPMDITDQVYGSNCSNPITQNWAEAWVASGRTCQLRSGRIVAAIGVKLVTGGSTNNYIIYSDDGGTTWTPSTVTGSTAGNEAKIAELNSGTLLMSIRNSGGHRRMNTSADHGVSWGTPYLETDLPDPGCNGDMIRYSSTLDGWDKNRLLHSIPNASTRKNVSVYLSEDEGNTWPVGKTIYPQGSEYSSLTVLDDNSIGLFYENDETGITQLYFARFSLNWLAGETASLPITLLRFDAAVQGKNALLSWASAEEINAAGYNVQRSADGKMFATLGFVRTSGSGVQSSYTFTDVSPLNGVNYYRLQLVDRDGQYSYSPVRKLRYSQGGISLEASPNPVTDKLYLQLQAGQAQGVQVAVYDALAHRLLSKSEALATGANMLTISTQAWAPGLYQVVVSNKTGAVLKAKIVKMR